MKPGIFIAWTKKHGDPDIEPTEFDTILKAVEWIVEFEYVLRLGKFLFLEDGEGVLEHALVSPFIHDEVVRRGEDIPEPPKKHAKRYPDARFLVQVLSPRNVLGEPTPQWQLVRATSDGGNAAHNLETWARILGTDRVRVIDRLVEGVDQ